MFFITVFDRCIPNGSGFADFGDQRTWGYYPEYDMAVNTLHENRTDLHEGCYTYAVVEEIGPGISANVKQSQWFKWDKEKGGFFEIETPECVKHFSNFAIG